MNLDNPLNVGNTPLHDNQWLGHNGHWWCLYVTEQFTQTQILVQLWDVVGLVWDWAYQNLFDMLN